MKKRSSAVLAVLAVTVAAFLAFSASALAVAAKFHLGRLEREPTMAPSSLASTRPVSATTTSITRSRPTPPPPTPALTEVESTRRRPTRRHSTRMSAAVDRSSPRTGVSAASIEAGPISAGRFLLPGWPAPRARRRLVHAHRADGHDERCEHHGPRQIEDVLHVLSSQVPAGATLGGFWRRDGLDHGGAQSSPWQPAGIVAPLPQPGKGQSSRRRRLDAVRALWSRAFRQAPSCH